MIRAPLIALALAACATLALGRAFDTEVPEPPESPEPPSWWDPRMGVLRDLNLKKGILSDAPPPPQETLNLVTVTGARPSPVFTFVADPAAIIPPTAWDLNMVATWQSTWYQLYLGTRVAADVRCTVGATHVTSKSSDADKQIAAAHVMARLLRFPPIYRPLKLVVNPLDPLGPMVYSYSVIYADSYVYYPRVADGVTGPPTTAGYDVWLARYYDMYPIGYIEKFSNYSDGVIRPSPTNCLPTSLQQPLGMPPHGGRVTIPTLPAPGTTY